MRNNKLLKMGLLCCLSLMAVSVMAIRPDIPADYRCVSIGKILYDDESGSETVEGWTRTEDGLFMSDEVDLSNLQNPVVIVLSRYENKPMGFKKLLASEDGITYSEYTCSGTGLTAIPKSIKRVKIELEYPEEALYLIIGERWTEKTSKDYSQKLDYRLVTGKDSTDSWGRHIYRSVPMDNDVCHHQMEFTAKVGPVKYDGETQETFLENAVVGIRLNPYDGMCFAYFSDYYEQMEYCGDVLATITFTCGSEVIRSGTLSKSRFSQEEIGRSDGVSPTFYALVPRNATEMKLRLEWNTKWPVWGEEDFYSYIDEEIGEKKWWSIEKVTTTPPEISVKECHVLAGETSQLNLLTNPEYWFDYDGDGVKEWFFGNSYAGNTINKFRADLLSSYPCIKNVGSFNGWINYGHDEHTDAYSTHVIYKMGSNNAEKVLVIPGEGSSMSTPTLRPLDFNNDGKPDFWKGQQYDPSVTTGEVLTMSGDGTFVSELIPLMTADEYYNYVKETGGGTDLGFGFGSVSGSRPTIGANGSSFAQIDINNDGYLDFIDYPSGYYLLNTGDGRFVIDKFGGTVAIRDFDNDGINDIFLYDEEEQELSVYLQRTEGEPVVQKLFSGLNCSQPIWIRDFDKDGDLDILAAFNAKDNEYGNPNSETYLLMFENNGNGTFKRHEHFIEGKVNFVVCTDYNADGNYEVIGWTQSEDSHYDSNLGDYVHDWSIWSCPTSGLKVNSTCELIGEFPYKGDFDGNTCLNTMSANIDNSGLTRLVFSNRMLTPSGGKNSRPQRPSAPKVSYNASTGEVYVAWDRGNDRETPQLDLTYELRIGTAPDKGDIVYAYATADGSRLNMLDGNCGFSTYRRLDASGWPEGTVYVSIQVVDDGKMGSEFSEYATFEKKEPAGSFIITNVDGATVGDEFVLTLDRAKVAGSTYSWNLGDGTIKSENGNSWTVTFPTAGKKDLTLSIVSASGNRSAITRTVTVAGSRAEKDMAIGDRYVNAAFDMDLDGKTEILAGCFFEGDDAGNYTTVKRMFNSQLNTYDYKCDVVDLNNDGMPDVVGRYRLVNEGDKSMTVIADDNYDSYSLVADFDNDGFIDIFSGETIKRNGGDYSTFADVTTIPGAAWAADFNGDGLADLLCSSKEVLLNKGNFNFEIDKDFPAEGLPDEEDYKVCIDDFDGNGGLDVAWTSAHRGFQEFIYADTLTVRWSDGSLTEIPAPSGHRFRYVSGNSVDFDNNGCKDVYVSLDGNEGVIVYFNPDRSYHIEKDAHFYNRSLLAYRRTDGRTGIDGYVLYGSGNEAPSAPSRLRASQNSRYVTIEWNRGSDKETPAAALRYNISIRHKGAEGEGAYFMSPLNGGVNGVAVPSGKPLLTAPKITIPVEAIPAGEYEVMVQAVDMQWMQSDFSDPLTFTVAASGAFDLPSATMVGKTETVRLYAGINPADIDFGEGAEVVSSHSQSVEVRWLTEGTKTVTCGGFSSSIHVHPALNAGFTLPEEIFIGSKVRISCDNDHNSKWELVQYTYWDNPDFFTVIPVPQNDIYSLRTIDANTVEFTFSGNSWQTNFAIRHTVSAEYGSDVCEVRPNFIPMAAATEIGLVDIDGDGHYRLTWDIPSELASKVTGVNIYKETSTFGRFEQIATLGTGTNSYSDAGSMPAIKSERYAISYVLTYGETKMSVPHMPMHLMINHGADNGWNLCWNRYEGRDIATYRILRGTSPETLQLIAEVAGSNSSYSDFTAPAGTSFYAVEIIADALDMPLTRSRVAATPHTSRSNVVSTDEAGTLIPATSILISCAGGDFTIDGKQVGAIQLMATVYPLEATMRKVDWVVVDGSDVVSVNSRGLVSAINDGTAVIRATATDGSGIYAEITVSVNNVTSIKEVVTDANPEERPNDIYTLQGILIKRDAKEADIRQLAPGLYIIAGRKVLVR